MLPILSLKSTQLIISLIIMHKH